MTKKVTCFIVVLVVVIAGAVQLSAAVIELYAYPGMNDYNNPFDTAWPPNVAATDYFNDGTVHIAPADPGNWGVECWVNLSALPGEGESPESVLICVGGDDSTSAFRLEAYGPGGNYTLMGHIRGHALFQGSTDLSSQIGNWIHVALVVENGSGKLYFSTDPSGELNLDGDGPAFAWSPGKGITIGCAREKDAGDQGHSDLGFYYGTKGQIKNVRVFEFGSGEFDPHNDPLPLQGTNCKVYSPTPKCSDIVSPLEDLALTWQRDEDSSCGSFTEYHVYFDENLALLATNGDKGFTTNNSMVIGKSQLQEDSTYYWRVDTVYEIAGEPNTVEGSIWKVKTSASDTFTVQAFYEMEEDPNVSLLLDSSGNGHDLPVIDGGADNEHVSEVAPLKGGGTTGNHSLHLNGNDIYGLAESLCDGSGFVIEAYVKVDPSNSGWRAIAGCGGWTNGELLAVSGTDVWGWLRGGLAWEFSTTGIDPDAWVHLALVRGEGYNEGKLTLLWNHVKVAEVAAAINPPEETYIGGMRSGGTTGEPTSQFRGWVDNIRFSNFTGNFHLDDLLPAVQPYCGQPGQVYKIADLNQDCYVNLVDFAILAADWLQCNDPARPDICPSSNGQ